MLQISLIIFIKLTIEEGGQELCIRNNMGPVSDIGVVVKRFKVVEGTRILTQKFPEEG